MQDYVRVDGLGFDAQMLELYEQRSADSSFGTLPKDILFAERCWLPCASRFEDTRLVCARNHILDPDMPF